MSLIPLQGNEILVDTPESVSGIADRSPPQPGQALVGWIMQRVTMWENVRERGYGRLWAQYWRLWRGKWDSLDANRESERSRVITPALAQAIEASVAEIEEAVFNKDIWFDVDMRKTDQKDLMNALLARDELIDDMELVNVKGAVSESALNAAIMGTGIIQVNVQVEKERKPQRDPKTQKLSASSKDRVTVSAESIRPDEFIPDPAGTRIDQMLAVAVKRVKPQHYVLEMIQKGAYLKSALPFVFAQHRLLNRDIDKEIDPQSQITVVDADELEIVEWHGKVPLGLLDAALRRNTDADEVLDSEPEDADDEKMIEAVVTIANGHVLLKAQANPFIMKDRGIIAYQWETVPGRFWGRGVAEKGYNPQIALDASVRAYIDALGFISAPMLGVDSGRIPKGFKNAVYPGKVWLTQGNPAEVLTTVQIGKFEPAMFQQASEMERMVQMGTGAFDTMTALNSQSQSGANSMSSNSMMMGAFVKRAKRVVQNVDRHLLTPLITKFLWRYMQFDPQRYPAAYDFIVKATMGIVAREAEAMQLTQLMGMMPDEFHSAKLVLAKGIIENTAISNKAEIMQVINQALAPNPQQQQQQQQMQQLQMQAQHAQLEGLLLDNQVKIANIREILARADMEAHKGAISLAELDQEQQRLHQEWQSLRNQAAQIHVSAVGLTIDDKKADAALIAARKKPSGSKAS